MKSRTAFVLIVCGAAIVASHRAAAVHVDYCGSLGECASGAACRTQPMGHVCGMDMACVFANRRCEVDTVLCNCLRGGVLFTDFPTPLIIEDNNPADLTVSIDVPSGAGVILDMVIQLAIEHTQIGDLVATLSHGGTTVTLIDRPGAATSGPGCDAHLSCERPIYLSDAGSIPIECSGPPCGACFPNGQVPAAPFVPNQALSAFDHQNASGPWVLSISDNAPGNVGALCRWGISMAYEIPIPVADTPWGVVKERYR